MSVRFVGIALVSLALMSLAGCAREPSILDNFTPAATAPPEGYVSPPAVDVGTCPWDAPSAVGVADGTDPVAITESLAVAEDRFWPLIESVPDLPTEDDFREMSSALAGCAPSDLIAFEARLRLALYALDGPDNFDWIAENDPMGLHFASDDSFLYSRCATVLAGRETWSRAVREGTLEWGSDDADVTGVSEWLLYVGLDAAEAQGQTIDNYYDEVYGTIPLSYETRSNETLWGKLN